MCSCKQTSLRHRRPQEAPGEEDLPVTWLEYWLVVLTIQSSSFIFWSLHNLYQTWSKNTKRKILRLNTILSVKIFPPPHPFLLWLLGISLLSTDSQFFSLSGHLIIVSFRALLNTSSFWSLIAIIKLLFKKPHATAMETSCHKTAIIQLTAAH